MRLLLLLLTLITQKLLLVSGQQQWSGFANSFGSLLDFSCPNNSVLTGIASDFSRAVFDRQWEFLCGTGGGLASIATTNCTLQPAINPAQADILFSCPEGGYLAGFRSLFMPALYDRVWEPYCCTRPASALINCAIPTSRYENDLRANLNFTAATDRIIVGVDSFYFNRDRRWRFETCQIEVSCGDPGIPANALRTGDRFLYRDQVTFQCQDGYYQSSGPVGGVRECLVSGEWSGTQPVCSECGAIDSCEQVLCSNASDHVCDRCESNTGPLPDQMAYINLQTECLARCSWLGTYCYPGVCPNTSQSCDCVEGFQGLNCLDITTPPSLPSCALSLEGPAGATLSTSCLPSNLTSPLFTNISPHTFRGMWEGLYMAVTPPPRPAYLSGYEVGVAVSEMTASVYRAANPTEVVSTSSHTCDMAPPTPDQPVTGVVSCTASAAPTSLVNHTFLHGDTVEVSVRLEAGGYLDVLNLDTNITTRQYYTGTPTIGGAVLVLDFQPPTHCTLTPAGCPGLDRPLLALSGEIVREGNVSVTWGGWLDVPAGLQGYLLSVHRLEEVGGELLEVGLVATTVYNETGEQLYREVLDLPQEGPYSVILQALDNADNIRYARRLVLYDANSTLNLDPLVPLTVVSAVPGTMWQNSTLDPIIISGRGHFYNSHLRDSDLLAPVGDAFNGSITTAYDHPLQSGRYPRGGTPNALGVVVLEYDVITDQVGGASAESLAVPEMFRFESDNVSLSNVNLSLPLRDGDSVRVWFRASDYNSQQVTDSVLIHVDSSGPSLSELGLVRHGLGGLRLHGQSSLTDLTIEFDLFDQHSGVLDIEWSIGTEPGLADVGYGNVPVQVIMADNCTAPECVCNSVLNCSLVHYIFSPPPSDLLVPPTAHHDSEYHITITATNHALLSTHLSLVVTVDATPPLPGAVFDGPLDQGVDIDYTTDHTLQGWWAGFFDQETDVMFYQYVFAPECVNSSVFTYPLPSDSVIMETGANTASMQAPGAGTYYLTVVAWSTALTPSTPVCSNGLTVDLDPPIFQGVVVPGAVVEGGLARDAGDVVWWVGPDRQRELVREGAESSQCVARATVTDLSAYPVKMLGSSAATVPPDVCLTGHTLSPSPLTLLPHDHTLNISWLALDNTGLREYYIAVGNESAVTSYRVPTLGQPHFSLSLPQLLAHGAVFNITVTAEDLAGHTSSVSVGPVLIDLTPPLVNGSLYVWEEAGHVMVTWSEDTFSEEEEGAGPVTLQYAIGLTQYGQDVLSFKPLPLTTPPSCPNTYCLAIDPTSETTPLVSGRSYAITISATNRAKLTSFLTSDLYLYASATPTSCLVLDFDPWAEVSVISGSSYHMSDIDVLLENSSLGVRWEGFAHSHTNVSYSVALGLTPGSHDVMPLISVGGGVSSYVFYNVTLRPGSTYYATVVADTGFSSVTGSSNGVWVYGGGVAALRQASVYDGQAEYDLDYQVSVTAVSAQWSFPSDLHDLISHYEWAVLEEGAGQVGVASASGSGASGLDMDDMLLVRGYANVGKDTSVITAMPSSLVDSRRYRNAVRACFANFCLPPVLSDGFELSAPPTPGMLNATYVSLERDLVYCTSSYGRFELRWEGFSHQQVLSYEWSVGEEVGGALWLPWRQVEWYEDSVSVLLNVTLSLHHENIVNLRALDPTGLYVSISTPLRWEVEGRVVSRDSCDPLVVYDITPGADLIDLSATGWTELSHSVTTPQDMQYSPSPSSLAGAWPELRYSQYNYSISSLQEYTSCDNQLTIACGTTFHNSVSLEDLPLLEGVRYYICVRALAEDAIHRTLTTPPVLDACSDGATVDLSPPLGGCVKITCPPESPVGPETGSGVGAQLEPEWDRSCAGVNESRFQVSTSDLYLVWEEFRDVEGAGSAVHASGVAYYSYAIGTAPLNTDVLDYTSVGVASYVVVRGLSLQSGLTYYATIRATDFTGRHGYVVSSGVRIDTSEPIVGGIRLTDIASFQTNLQLEWNLVTDSESDITSLEWSLGTRLGSSNITGWRSAGMEQNTGLVINTTQFNLYDGQILFASLKAVNRAGLVGVASSLPYLLDSSPPEVGVVYDGATPLSDEDYLTEEGVVRAHWRGFADPHSEIVEYWWAIGTCQACSDIQPLISVGVRQAAWQSSLPLIAGGRYYVLVRACNALGLCAEAASDGAVLDLTPPIRGRVLDGLTGGDIQYQPSQSVVSAHWVGFHDNQSPISHYVYYVGTSPNGSDLALPTTLPAGHTSFLHQLATPLSAGTRVYSTVWAYNRAGHYISAASNGVTLDGAPPQALSEPSIITEWAGSRFEGSQFSTSALMISWNFTDNLHAVYQYYVSVRSESASRLATPPQRVLTTNTLSLLPPQLSLSDGKMYHVLVRGCDVAGVCVSAPPSLPVLLDASPPIDGYFAVSTPSVANISESRTVPGGMTWRNRPVRGVAQLNLAFLGFSDPHSGILQYWVTVGTSYSGRELLEPVLLDPALASNETVEVWLGQVTLTRQVLLSEVLYVSLWAVNGVGLSSHVVQASFTVQAGVLTNNGTLALLRAPCVIESCLGHCTCAARGSLCDIQPSLLPPCLPSPPPSSLPLSRVVNVFSVVPQLGANATPSPLFTTVTDQLYGRWELADPASQEIQRFDWSVGIQGDVPGAGLIDLVDGIVWRDAGAALSAVFTVSEEYPLLLGEVYVFHVRAWYSAQEYSVFSSEGVTVDYRGPQILLGQRVRELGVEGARDVDFTPDPSTLQVAWGGVISRQLSGNYSELQLAVGDAPGADNVYPLTSVSAGLETTTISDLLLEQGVRYYTLLRATNPLGVSATSISDGVLVDLTPPDVGEVLSGCGPGPVSSLAQAGTESLAVCWYGFHDDQSSVHHYEVAVSNTSFPPSAALYQDVGITMTTTLTPTLIPGGTYYAHVVPVNGAGLRSPAVTSRGVAIQPDRPEGRVCTQRGVDLLDNPSFEGSVERGVPCPSQPLSVAMATQGWQLDTSYIRILTYPEAIPTNIETTPPDGCSAVAMVGSIWQRVATVPGERYQFSFSYNYQALPQRAAVRVQLPGLDKLVFRSSDYSGLTRGWGRVHVEFVAEDTNSVVVISSTLSYSPVYIDHVALSGCGQYEPRISAELAVTWPGVIQLNYQVVSSSKVILSANWDVVDPIGGVKEYWWAVGTVAGGEQLQAYRPSGPTPATTSELLAVSQGQEVHITVLVVSHSGRRLLVHSRPYLVDLTPPLPEGGDVTVVIDGTGPEDMDYQSSTVVGVNWSALVDSESGLKQCSWAIGTAVGLYDVQQFLPIRVLSPQNTTATSDLSLEHGATVYSTVVCTNEGGLTSVATSDGVTILYQAPTSDAAYVSITSPTYTQYSTRQGYLPSPAAVIHWDGFAESALTPLEYEVRVLEGGVVGQGNWTNVGSAKMLTVQDLDLTENVTSHVVEIRAVNLGGVVSEPVRTRVAVVSVPPQDTGVAINSSWSGDNVLTVDWSDRFTSPAPLYFELSLGTQMGSGSVRKWVELSTMATSYVVSSELLDRSEDYFVTVTAIGSSGLHSTASQLLAGVPVGM